MQFAGIFHKTSEQMSYALNENELIVNLRTGYDVRRVFIHYGDPFESGILGGNEKWTGKREEICFKKRLRRFSELGVENAGLYTCRERTETI